MSCGLPCYNTPTFDYKAMNCFLQKNTYKTDGSIKVVFMVKSPNGGFTYKEKPVMYFVPNKTNPSTALAYIIPGHSDNYIYMYLLSTTLGHGTYSGEHFTFGNKYDGSFDLHYTTYDYLSGNRPYHIYYDIKVNKDTTPELVSRTVCAEQGWSGLNEHMTRCYFFTSVMQAIHDEAESCNKVFEKHYKASPQPFSGGGKSKRKQRGGDEQIVLDETKAQSLVSNFKNVKELTQVEFHNMKSNYGLVTFFINTSIDTIVYTDGGSRMSVSDQEAPFSFPFDFAKEQFISMEEFVSVMKGSQHQGVPKRLDVKGLCMNQLVDFYFSDRNITKVVNTCQTDALRSFVSPQRVMLPMTAGKKQQRKKTNNTNKNKEK